MSSRSESACGVRIWPISEASVVQGNVQRQAGRARAALHILSQFTHRFLRYGAAFAPGHSAFGFIHSRQYFQSATLSFFPQRERFLNSVVLAVKSSALDGLANKGLLIRGELYFHLVDVKDTAPTCQSLTDVPRLQEELAERNNVIQGIIGTPAIDRPAASTDRPAA